MTISTPREPDTGTARRVLRSLGIEIHPGEAPMVMALFGTFFFCLCFQYAAKSVRQASFVDTFGAERLPLVYLAVALLTVPIVYVYGRLADRLPPARLTVLTCTTTAAGLTLFWWLYGSSASWVPFVFYLFATTAIALNLSQIWALASRILDPRQARRLFTFLGAGSLLGGIAGGQTASLVSQWVDTRATLLAGAAALLAAAALAALAARVGRASNVAASRPRQQAVGALADVVRSPQLRTMAIVFGLSIVVAQIIDLQFNWVVQNATRGLDQRTAFFGNFYSVTGVAGVVFQLLLTSRIQRGRGVGFALRVLPVTLSVGTAALLVAGGLFPGLLLATGLVLKVGENGLRYSLDQVTRELLFLPIPDSLRVKAKAVIDVLVQRGAKGLAAFLLLPVVFGWLSPVDVGWLSLVLIGAWLAFVPGLYRQYVDAYREALRRSSAGTHLPIDLTDVHTLEALMQSLGSPDSRQALHALELLASHGRGHLVPPVLLHHEDPLVRRRTLRILADTGRDDAMPLVESRLRDEDPEVRTEAIHVLASLRHVDAASLMFPRLDEPDPAIRAAAVACVSNLGNDRMRRRASRALRDMLHDPEPTTRLEAARCLGAVYEPSYRDDLLQLLYDPELCVVREAIASARRRISRDEDPSIYMPTLISLLRVRQLKHEVRESLVAFGAVAIPALAHFLNDADEHVWVRRAIPKTLIRIASPAARTSLVESLSRQSDPFLRRKIIEALNSSPAAEPLSPATTKIINDQIRAEAARYLQIMADVHALESGPQSATGLLRGLLLDRLEGHLENLFGLLALCHPADHIWAAHRSLTAAGSATRGHALEYLDNTLDNYQRRAVFAAIDAQPIADKLRQARELFGTRTHDLDEVLAAYLDKPSTEDADACFLMAASLHGVCTGEVSSLYPQVHRLAAEAEDPFVLETARWAEERIATTTA